MVESDIADFCELVRKRSRENRQALATLGSLGLTGHVLGVLRQELDSMVRCIYLLHTTDRAFRLQLIQDLLAHQPWRRASGSGKITDAEMVAISKELHGWAQMVYKFGCAFIHLSSYHDYSNRDPLSTLSREERIDLEGYLESYHGCRLTAQSSLDDIVPVLPAVFEKIASNLEHYLHTLETDGELD